MGTQQGGISRRGALFMGMTGLALGSGVVSALLDDGPAAGAVAPTEDQLAPAAAAARGATLAPAARGAATARDAASRVVPPWDQSWSTAMRRIDDFTRRSPGTRYPARAIMLTIDDGPNPIWTPRYLQLLARYRVRATFCMIGMHVHDYPGLARQVVAHGHTIANHTWTHDEQLPYRDAGSIQREIAWTSDAIHRATGFVVNQFRAPGGVWGPAVFAELYRQHLMPLGWDIDPRDWALPGTWSITQSMLAAGPHDIILCHDGGGDRSETYAALQTVIPTLLRRGYQFVGLPAPQPHHR